LFVAAAGNGEPGESLNSDNSDGKVYPANFTGVSNLIAVAATDCLDPPTCTDILWNESHYGRNTVHIAAPGNDINSTHPISLGGSTSTLPGTSAAAPHVSGCAALLQARKLAKTGTLLSITETEDLLFNNSDATIKDPTDPTKFGVIGGRRLNCAKSMAAVPVPPDEPPPAAPTNLTVR
jgi:subtilisin family serine protease